MRSPVGSAALRIGVGRADELVGAGGDALTDIDDLSGGQLRNFIEFHVRRTEALDIDLSRPVDRDFDNIAIVEKRLQRGERTIEKIVPVVGGKLRGGRVHDGSPSVLR